MNVGMRVHACVFTTAWVQRSEDNLWGSREQFPTTHGSWGLNSGWTRLSSGIFSDPGTGELLLVTFPSVWGIHYPSVFRLGLQMPSDGLAVFSLPGTRVFWHPQWVSSCCWMVYWLRSVAFYFQRESRREESKACPVAHNTLLTVYVRMSLSMA